MSSAAVALMLASAIYSYSYKIWDVRLAEGANDTCHVSAQADNGPLVAEVTWSPCKEIKIRVMSAAELNEAGQLENLGWIRDALMDEPKQLVLTAWGPHAATAYARGHRTRATTLEIPLAD